MLDEVLVHKDAHALARNQAQPSALHRQLQEVPSNATAAMPRSSATSLCTRQLLIGWPMGPCSVQFL